MRYAPDGVFQNNPTEKFMVNEELMSYQETPAAQTADTKTVLTPEQQKARNGKILTIVTYSIALLCMLLGIFLPLFVLVPGGKAVDNMLLKHVPGAFNALLSPFIKKNIIPIPEGFFIDYPVYESFSSEILALVVYLITCLLGIFMLIPVLLGDRNKNTSAACAYVIEVLAALSSGYYLFSVLRFYEWGNAWPVYNFVIVFGGSVLMLAIQSVYNKGGLGVTKIILMVLSGLLFLFLTTLLPTIPALGKIFDSLSKMLGSGETAAFANGTDYTVGIMGLNFLDVLKLKTENTLVEKLFVIICGLFVCTCSFNFAYDVFELSVGSKYDKQGVFNQNKPMSVIAILRYALALVLAAASVALLLVSKDVYPGVYLYITTLIILIQLIFALVRAGVLASKRKKAVKADEIAVKPEHAPVFDYQPVFDDEEPEYDEDVERITIETPVYQEKEYVYTKPVPIFQSVEQPEYEEDYYEVPDYDEEQYEEDSDDNDDGAEQLVIPGTPEPEVKTEERTFVYNYKAVYNGPTDSFMDTLTDTEKIEFVQIFVEKTRGAIKGVPDYMIGMDNSDFFPAVFIHINRAREMVSTHLLEKMYKQLGK